MLRARKRFGQHFLEPAWVDKLVQVIAPAADQVFVEIGPGRGALTGPLAARAKHVLAFEIDRRLAAELRRRKIPHLAVLDRDFLRVSADELREELAAVRGSGPIRAVGNLPYSVGSPILFHLMKLYATGIPIADATVMLQREVVNRLMAVRGTRDYGVLTVLIAHSAKAERILALPPGAFRPVPKVHSALVRLHFHTPEPPVKNPAVFAALVQSIFTRRRKTLVNALGAFPLCASLPAARAVDEAGLDGTRRPETLALPELVRLADTFVSHLVAPATAVL